ncbi:hypothetical protein AB0G00_24095 [Nocardia salmonicida]|uniref:hypothetical protein n=1 Tax=Nocardia salmonicida TaxID=53431 RepID=UPI0033E3A6B1
MPVNVVRADGTQETISAGAGFRTDEEYNNLEVRDVHGSLVIAFAGGFWASAEVSE